MVLMKESFSVYYVGVTTVEAGKGALISRGNHRFHIRIHMCCYFLELDCTVIIFVRDYYVVCSIWTELPEQPV
jgi:hypothetical protein